MNEPIHDSEGSPGDQAAAEPEGVSVSKPQRPRGSWWDDPELAALAAKHYAGDYASGWVTSR